MNIIDRVPIIGILLISLISVGPSSQPAGAKPGPTKPTSLVVHQASSFSVMVRQPFRLRLEGSQPHWRVAGKGRIAIAILVRESGDVVAALGHWRTCHVSGCLGRTLKIFAGDLDRTGAVEVPAGTYELLLINDGAPVRFSEASPVAVGLLGESLSVVIESRHEHLLGQISPVGKREGVGFVAAFARASGIAQAGTCHRPSSPVAEASPVVSFLPCRESGGKGGSAHAVAVPPGGSVEISTDALRNITPSKTLSAFGRAGGADAEVRLLSFFVQP